MAGLTDEYSKGVEWVAQNLNFKKSRMAVARASRWRPSVPFAPSLPLLLPAQPRRATAEAFRAARHALGGGPWPLGGVRRPP